MMFANKPGSQWIGLSIHATLYEKLEQGRNLTLYPEQHVSGAIQLQKSNGQVNEKNLEKCMRILGWDGTEEGAGADFSHVECEVWVVWSQASPDGKYKPRLQIANISEARGARQEMPAEKKRSLFAGIAAKVGQIKHDMALKQQGAQEAPPAPVPPKEAALSEVDDLDVPEESIPF